MTKVLLVEDDNNLREIYEARLQAEGYEIAAAQDGEQALVVAKDFKPDLVISDVMMPKISGFEMLDILRNTEGLQNTRVIMLTALSQAEDKTRADSLGADRYLVKSQVTLEDIIKAAHDILGDGGEPAEAASSTPPTAPDSPAPASDAPATSDPTPVAEPPKEESAPTTAEDAIAQAVESEKAASAPAPAAEPATPVPTDQSKDDQLLAEAATSLTGTAGAPAEPVASDIAAEPTIKNDNTPSAGSSAGSSKRVIQPLDSEEAKPTLEELLSREEAKEITGGTVKPTVSNTPPAHGSTTAQGQAAASNPHDIAL
jgi:CheY-like chemotaxis protein